MQMDYTQQGVHTPTPVVATAQQIVGTIAKISQQPVKPAESK
jgi:hypothetical protein